MKQCREIIITGFLSIHQVHLFPIQLSSPMFQGLSKHRVDVRRSVAHPNCMPQLVGLLAPRNKEQLFGSTCFCKILPNFELPKV